MYHCVTVTVTVALLGTAETTSTVAPTAGRATCPTTPPDVLKEYITSPVRTIAGTLGRMQPRCQQRSRSLRIQGKSSSSVKSNFQLVADWRVRLLVAVVALTCASSV